MKPLFSWILVLTLSMALYAEGNDARKILDRVKTEFLKVKDYEVQVKVKIDVEFVKVPETNATIFFKQPDKFKVNSDKFAMLPRQGFNFSPASFLQGDYTAIIEKEESLEHNPCYVIKVIPVGGTNDIVLSTLWIDKTYYSIRKIEVSTRNSGIQTILLDYDVSFIKQYPLPSSMLFLFDLSKINFQRGHVDEMNDDGAKQKKKKMAKGMVNIYYSNYKVNSGLSDSIFESKKSGKGK
jgi:outer membrane lipoprotein-sorting protein